MGFIKCDSGRGEVNYGLVSNTFLFTACIHTDENMLLLKIMECHYSLFQQMHELRTCKSVSLLFHIFFSFLFSCLLNWFAFFRSSCSQIAKSANMGSGSSSSAPSLFFFRHLSQTHSPLDTENRSKGKICRIINIRLLSRVMSHDVLQLPPLQLIRHQE